MSSTLVRKSQIRPLNIVRSDINTTTSGSALITKIIAGTGLTLSSSTGVNPGTGDVTVALSIATASTLGGVKIGSGLTVAVDGTISVTSVSTSWGSITGLLPNQLDLQAALNAKYNIPTGTTSQYIDGTGALQTFPSSLATGFVRHQVKAGVAINKGQAVYVSSSDGTNMIVGLASNAAESTSSKTMGLLDATVSINGFANVVTEGLLAGLNTIGANAGDPVWLGTGGNLIYGLANKPYAPKHLVFIGIVTRVNANNGEIFVKVQNGYELDELHDIDLKTNVPSLGQLLRYDSDGLWKNWTPNYLTSFTETDPTVPAHVKAITTTNISNWNTAYSWGNHATQSYATQSYVNTAISNLIDTAPATLDTLNELAAALGDDPNFATTVTNNIATKVSKSGDTMTGNLNWTQTDRGVTWGFNTDGAYIKFFNTGDGDTNSRLEYATFDNGDEYHRWLISNIERMTLRSEGLNVNGVVYSNGYGNSTEWNTAYGWGNHALAGYLTSVTNISGNAGTATILQTARTLTIGNTGKTFNGSANVAWTLSEIGAFSTAGGTISGVVTIESSSDGILNLKQLGIVGTAGTKNAGWNYIQFLDSEGDRQGYFGIDSAGNFQFASEITGLALIGSDIIATRPWVISQSYITASASITGNAATATTLQTARTINGTSFNGSANIETSYWGTTRTLTIGNTGKTVNGSGNQSWSLAEIGAQPAGSYAAASHTHDDRYYTETESDARFLRYYGVNTEADFQAFQDAVGEIRFDQINDYNNLNNAPDGYNYGGVLSMRGDNFGFQIWGSHTGDLRYKTQWSDDNYTGWRSIITSVNIGSQSVNYANSAGSVAWTNVSGRPTALSSFTNDSGYITTTGRAFPKRANGTNINFNIENGIVNSGNPTAILGTTNNIDIEAYSPAGLSVNYANSAGSVAWTNVSGRPTAVSAFTNDAGYLTSLPSHNHDDRYLTYAASNEPSNLAAGWYTIAVNSGNRASGKFILRDTSSGNHQSVVFYATHHFGSYSDITVLINSRYSGNPFRYIRIKDGGTYDGALLQVYLDQGSNTVRTWLLENIQANGWIVKNWVADGTNPGDLGNFAALTEIPAQVDLDYAPQGGMITTGDIYGGGDTTQYLYLNANNYNSYSPTLTGGGASGTWGINITGSAGSVAWTNVSGRPTTVSSFTNDSGYITSAALSSYVPTSRTITINGVGYDLSANRSWTVSGTDSTKLPLAGGTMTGVITTVSSGTAINFSGQSDSFGYNATAGLGTYIKGTSNTYIYGGGVYYDGTTSRTIWHSGNLTNLNQLSNGPGYVTGSHTHTSFGNLSISPTSASWAEGIAFTMPSTSTWGGLRWRRERANNDGNWYIGYTALDSTDDLVFGANNGGSQVDNILRLTKAGNVSTVGTMYAAGYRGNANVGGTGEATWHPAGIYSGGTEWLYGHMYRNSSNTYGQGQIYFDSNYGYGMVGLYSSTRYQAIFAMGDSYKLPVDGTSTGSLYGLAWSHPNAGGVAGNLNTHGLLVMENGTFLAAISGSIRARDDVRAPALYDSGNRVAISRGEGRNYVDYSRYVYNNGAYSGSGWVEPSDLGVRYAASANYATSAGSASSASNATRADLLNGYGAAYGDTHPGHGLRVWYDWAYSGTYRNGITIGSHPSDTYYGWQIFQNMWDDRTYTRRYNGGFQGTYTLMTLQHDPYAGNMNQYVRTSDSVTFGEIYTNGWLRNNANNTGLYNQTNGNHFYSNGGGSWGITGNGGNVELQFRSNHQSTLRGYVYGDTSSNFGLLNDQGGWSVRCYSGGGYGGALTGSWTASGDLIAYSDARVKTNVATIENALEKVLQLRGVTYVRTDGEDHSEKIGVIAQEIREILPQVVHEQTDGMLGVSYGNIVGVLIEAIKEQQKEIEELKSKLN